MSETSDWNLWACSEFCGVLPDGSIRPADRSSQPHWRVNAGETLRLTTPRNGWLSFRAVVQGAGEFTLAARAGGGIVVELFREFYHKLKDADAWIADALVPIRARGQRLVLPDPDNLVPNQAAQGVWVDVFVPPDAKPGTHLGKITLKGGGAELTIDLAIDVMELS